MENMDKLQKASNLYSAMTDAVNNGTLINPTKPSFAQGPAEETRVMIWPNSTNVEVARMSIIAGANITNAEGQVRTRILNIGNAMGEKPSERWTENFAPNEIVLNQADIQKNSGSHISSHLPEEASQLMRAARESLMANSALALGAEAMIAANVLQQQKRDEVEIA
jgi:hypothetical protein